MKLPCSKPLCALLGTSIAFLCLSAPASAAPSFEDQVMEMLNQERWNNGNLPPLKRNAVLDLSSETHSTNMADRNFFQHCDPDTRTLPWDRMTAAGYAGWNAAAENIAAGYATPASVMAGWMSSSGHRANILSTSYREAGIGHFNAASDAGNVRTDSNGDCASDASSGGPYHRYWTQNFGRIGSVYPVVINREAFETESAVVSLYVYGSGWAQEMRFRNESGSWSAWQPYATNVSWTLSGGNGTKTVTAELKSGITVRSVSDVIELFSPLSDAGPDPGLLQPVLVLKPGHPNPFSSRTRLAYELPFEAYVRLTIHDPAGRVVTTLVNASVSAGLHDVSWDGMDESGRSLAGGVYFARLESGGEVRTSKLLLVR